MTECPICYSYDAVLRTENCQHGLCVLCFHKIYRTFDIIPTPYLETFANEFAVPSAVALRMACWMDHAECHRMVNYSSKNGCPVCRATPAENTNSEHWGLHLDFNTLTEEEDESSRNVVVPLPGFDLIKKVTPVFSLVELRFLKRLLQRKKTLIDLYTLQTETEENTLHHRTLRFFTQRCIPCATTEGCRFDDTNVPCPFAACQFSASSHSASGWADHFNHGHHNDVQCGECSTDQNTLVIQDSDYHSKTEFHTKLAHHQARHNPGPLHFSDNCYIYFPL